MSNQSNLTFISTTNPPYPDEDKLYICIKKYKGGCQSCWLCSFRYDEDDGQYWETTECSFHFDIDYFDLYAEVILPKEN